MTRPKLVRDFKKMLALGLGLTGLGPWISDMKKCYCDKLCVTFVSDSFSVEISTYILLMRLSLVHQNKRSRKKFFRKKREAEARWLNTVSFKSIRSEFF